MTLTTVAIQRYVSTVRPNNISKQRMIIKPDATWIQPLTLPWSPVEVDHSDLIANLVTQKRVGLNDTMIFNNQKLRKQSFTVMTDDVQIGLGRSSWPAEQVCEHFRQFGLHALNCTIVYDTYSSGTWLMTNLSWKITKRNPQTSEMEAAEITVEFTYNGDPSVAQGPVTGGAQSSAVASSNVAQPATATQTAVVRSYVVKAGDTLWSISFKFYGTGDNWRNIADVNGITNPRLLQIGTSLRIP